MYIVRAWDGSPFAGQVCDDGEVHYLGEFVTAAEARARMKAYCDRQRCQVTLSADGMAADFYNLSGSLTGGAQVIEEATYRCLACGLTAETEDGAGLPRDDEHCSHEWERAG